MMNDGFVFIMSDFIYKAAEDERMFGLYHFIIAPLMILLFINW